MRFKLSTFLGVILLSYTAVSKTKSVTVFIPGYYGSRLVDKNTNREAFLNLPAIFFSKSLQMKADLSYQTTLRPGDPMEGLRLIPGLLSIDGYGKAIARAKKEVESQGGKFLVFTYDWRLAPHIILENFSKQLTDWGIGGTSAELNIISHSMGSWLLAYWLRYGHQRPSQAQESWYGLKQVTRALFIGAPFRGTLAIFRNSFYGAPGLPSKNYLSNKVISSFPSTYYLAPEKGVFYSHSEDVQPLDLKNFKMWSENKWGALQFSDAPEVKEFIQYHLNESIHYYAKLHAPLVTRPASSPLLKVLVGKGQPTNDQGFIIGQSPLRFSFTLDQHKKNKLSTGLLPNLDVDGDGTIATESARPPLYLIDLGAQIQYVEAEHLAIIRDPQFISIADFISDVGSAIVTK